MIDDSDTQVDPQEQAELIANNPLQDIVRVWVAPYTGVVTISGTAQLLEPQGGYNAQLHSQQDGVRIAVQVRGQEVTSRLIGASDFTKKNIALSSIQVQQGDRIYFRVQSGTEENSNGENDQVEWSPVVTYTTAVPDDPNGYNHSYPAVQGTFLSDAGIIKLPVKDSYTVTGNFTKPVTSDSITLKVILGESQVVYEKTYTDQEVFNGSITIPVTNTIQADQLQFVMQSSSTVAW